MEIHERVQVLPVESTHRLRMFRIDVTEPDVLADHRAVLGFHQTVVAAVLRPRLGLFDEQFVQQPGDVVVDELAAGVAVKPADHKGKLFEYRFQYWQQPQLGDLRSGGHNLPLRHFVDGIDVI
jgi:hypothetical protein